MKKKMEKSPSLLLILLLPLLATCSSFSFYTENVVPNTLLAPDNQVTEASIIVGEKTSKTVVLSKGVYHFPLDEQKFRISLSLTKRGVSQILVFTSEGAVPVPSSSGNFIQMEAQEFDSVGAAQIEDVLEVKKDFTGPG